VARSDFREKTKQRLLSLREHGHFRSDPQAWCREMSAFAARCALRTLPSISPNGNFDFWRANDRKKHLCSIEAALCGSLLTGKGLVFSSKKNRDAADAADAAYAAAYAAEAYAAYAAAAASYAAYAAYAACAAYESAYAAYSDSYAAYAASYATDADATYVDADAAYEAINEDLLFLELNESKELLLEQRLWSKEGDWTFNGQLDRWREALRNEGTENLFGWYEGFLQNKPDWKAVEERFTIWEAHRPEFEPRREGSSGEAEVDIGNPSAKEQDLAARDPEVVTTYRVRNHGVCEQPTSEDALGFKPYAAGLTAYMTAPESRPPLTVSVEGNWGAGKSSFLMQVREHLGKAKIVWFNPWRHDEGRALWAAFLVEFVEQVESRMGWWDRLKARTRFFIRGMRERFFERLGLLALFVALAVGWFFLRKALISEVDISWDRRMFELILYFAPLAWAIYRLWKSFTGGLTEDVAKLWSRHDEIAKICAAERSSRRFREFLEVYLRRDERVYVFIDDLDRCAAPKAAELLDSLQLLISGNGNDEKPFPVVFVLGLDREKVAAGVAVKYEAMLPYVGAGMPDEPSGRLEAGREFGYEYLQKFVDVPFRIPSPAESEMDGYITKLLDRADSAATKATARKTTRGAAEAEPGPQQKSRAAVRTPDHREPEGRESGTPTGGQLETLEQTRDKIGDRFEDLDLKAALKMVAPMLGNNPRRVKQYLNLLRLRVALGETTGLFSHGVTVQQVAKMVALELARPVLYRRICEDPPTRWAFANAMTTSQPTVDYDDLPSFGDFEKIASGTDLHWLRRWHASLNEDLAKDSGEGRFPTQEVLEKIVHLSAPPAKEEAKAAEKMDSKPA